MTFKLKRMVFCLLLGLFGLMLETSFAVSPTNCQELASLYMSGGSVSLGELLMIIKTDTIGDGSGQSARDFCEMVYRLSSQDFKLEAIDAKLMRDANGVGRQALAYVCSLAMKETPLSDERCKIIIREVMGLDDVDVVREVFSGRSVAELQNIRITCDDPSGGIGSYNLLQYAVVTRKSKLIVPLCGEFGFNPNHPLGDRNGTDLEEETILRRAIYWFYDSQCKNNTGSGSPEDVIEALLEAGAMDIKPRAIGFPSALFRYYNGNHFKYNDRQNKIYWTMKGRR